MGPGELPPERLRGEPVSRLRLLALASLVAVAGHQAVLMSGAETAHASGTMATPHTTAWSVGVMLAMAVLLVVASWTAWRLIALRLHLASVPTFRMPSGDSLPRTWASIGFGALVIFLLQENAEHLIAHGHLPLLDTLLSGQYAATAPIFAGISLLAALFSLTVTRRISDLRLAASAARCRGRRPVRRMGLRARLADRRLRARMATGLMARRAPPASVAA